MLCRSTVILVMSRKFVRCNRSFNTLSLHEKVFPSCYSGSVLRRFNTNTPIFRISQIFLSLVSLSEQTLPYHPY